MYGHIRATRADSAFLLSTEHTSQDLFFTHRGIRQLIKNIYLCRVADQASPL